ncbi:MAG: peptidase domain-containing ABC transporter [Vicinamibacterales bacterium]
MSAPTPMLADPRDLRPAVLSLAHAHGILVDQGALDAAIRRLGRRQDLAPVDAFRILAAEAGLSAAIVRRPLAEVLADAAPSYPWLALRVDPDGRPRSVIVLRRQGRRVRVIEPGNHARAARWSIASLQAWLGVPDDRTAFDWVLVEPSAPLSQLRSPEGRRLDTTERLMALLVGERQTLTVAVVYSVVIGLLSLVVPVAAQSLVNTIAFGSALQPLVVLTLFVLVALGFSTAMNGLRAAIVEIVQRSVFARVATDVTHRLLRVRADAFDQHHGPELVNRFFDVVAVQKAASLLLIDGLSIVMQTMIGMILLAVYHPWLLAFDVLMIGAMFVIVVVLGRGAIETAIKESKAKYAVEGWLEQISAQLVTFKSAGGAAYATRRSLGLLEQYLEYRGKHFRILLRQIVASFGLQAIASAALLGVGGWLVFERQLTLGQLVASELVVTSVVSAFTKFGKQLEVYYDLNAAMDKLGDLVDLPLERRGGEAALRAHGPASLAVQGLEVQYGDAHAPALHLHHWHVAPGERIGLTGPNGSGKSTLADVLFALRTPSAGVVRIDDTDIRNVPLDQLREQVVLVRHVELFPASIVDNVRLGREHLSFEDVCAALDAVGLTEELLALPEGLNTVLQPHGRPLSDRQAARLMIARAIAGTPRLLVLDGAIDRIDGRNDRAQLVSLLFAPDAPWTLVCITDRADLLDRCNRVVRLEDGLAVELQAEDEDEDETA